jgi:hypothetical protein
MLTLFIDAMRFHPRGDRSALVRQGLTGLEIMTGAGVGATNEMRAYANA